MAYPPETNSGSVTSWVPLTTPFAMSKPCSTYFRLDGPSLMAFDPAYGIDVDPAATCGPKAVTSWWENSANHAVSIGPLKCPDGWETADTYVKGGTSTQAMCCPFGYYLANNDPGSNEVNRDCLSTVNSGQTLTYGSTAATNTNHFFIATTTIKSVSNVGAIAIVGWNIDREVTGDKSIVGSSNVGSPFLLSSQPSSSQPTSSQPTSARTTSPKPTGASHQPTGSTRSTSSQGTGSVSPSTTSPAAASTGDLSSGAKAGVGVGVSVGAVGIISLIVAIFILMRRRNESKGEDNSSTDMKQQHSPPNGVQDSDMASRKRWERSELDGRQCYECPPNAWIAELSATPKIGEAHVMRSPVELQDPHSEVHR